MARHRQDGTAEMLPVGSPSKSLPAPAASACPEEQTVGQRLACASQLSGSSGLMEEKRSAAHSPDVPVDSRKTSADCPRIQCRGPLPSPQKASKQMDPKKSII